MPYRVSLYQILHQKPTKYLSSEQKKVIAIKVIKALQQIGNLMKENKLPVAHSHLSSRNIFVNLQNMDV
jgi:NADH dehydrogenase FAD-containing subunit